MEIPSYPLPSPPPLLYWFFLCATFLSDLHNHRDRQWKLLSAEFQRSSQRNSPCFWRFRSFCPPDYQHRERNCSAKSWPETERRMAQSSCAERWSWVNVVVDDTHSLWLDRNLCWELLMIEKIKGGYVFESRMEMWCCWDWEIFFRISIRFGVYFWKFRFIFSRVIFDYWIELWFWRLKFVFFADTIWTFSFEEIEM